MDNIFIFFSENSNMVLTALYQHVLISVVAVVAGIIVALPAGILLTRNRKVASVVLAVFGVINTVPSLVLLGVAMMILGLGFGPAVSVLFVYSLLPIMRNTCIGIQGVDPKYLKAARGMGMSRMQILIKVQLPLALPVIIAGIRMSSIYIISWATLSAFIGAGGLGDLIWSGLQSYNYNMIFCGAIPATILALLVSFLLSFAEKKAVKYSKA
ncbi:MAG: ABC transporter permease [Christensenellales bacterium]|jgi:osmoprotectant transport system permease protein